MNALQLSALYGMKPQTASLWLLPLQEAFKVADITTEERAVCFLAQIGHETGCGRFLTELWGPTAQQLRYEPVTSLSARLGNTEPGDGKRFLGRGALQTTGRSNYRRLTVLMRSLYPDCPNFEANPEEVAKPRWALLSAALYWRDRKLNQFCDTNNFAELTRRINGGYNGLAHRQALYTKGKALCLKSSLLF